MYIESPKTVNEMTLNELVKLTTLWTTGPCSIGTDRLQNQDLHCLQLIQQFLDSSTGGNMDIQISGQVW